MLEPGLVHGGVARGLVEVDDAGAAIAGRGLEPRLHPLPLAERFERERNLGRVTAHLAAPAPVAAGLLAGDAALLHQGDGDAALGKRQRRHDADDAAADHHHRGPRRQRLVALE
jgi:hypothetical protein